MTDEHAQRLDRLVSTLLAMANTDDGYPLERRTMPDGQWLPDPDFREDK